MEKLDEEKIIAILYSNFNGKRKKIYDQIYIAEKVKQLSEFYGSYIKLADKLGISKEILREILKLLELPEEVKELIRQNKIKREVAWRIASIKLEQNQIKIAKAIIGLNTHQARTLVRIFKNDPSIDLSASYKRFQENKQTIEKINLSIIPIKQIDYHELKILASKQKINPEKYVSEIIIPSWLKKNKK